MVKFIVGSAEDMFNRDEIIAERLRELIHEEYDRFWIAFKDAIADLVERGYIR